MRMMRTSLLAVASIAAIMMASVSTASAATYVFTYSGTVSSGYDYTGDFGAAGGDLTGKDFKAVYTLTYPSANVVSDFQDFAQHQVYGGSAYGSATSSPVSAAITVNGVTQTIAGGYTGQAYLANYLGNNNGNFDLIQNDAVDYVDNYDQATDSKIFIYNVAQNSYKSYLTNFLGSNSFDQNLDIPVNEGEPFGYFRLNQSITDYTSGIFFQHHDSFAYMNTDHISLSSALPEPNIWSLMIIGLGVVGMAMRAKRRRGIVGVGYA